MPTLNRLTSTALLVAIAATVAIALRATPADAAGPPKTAADHTVVVSAARTSAVTPICGAPCARLFAQFVDRAPSTAATTFRYSVRRTRRYLTKAAVAVLGCEAIYRYYRRSMSRWELAAEYNPGAAWSLNLCQRYGYS